MMFLKHRYGLGYETLCREVADSISWTRFCRIPLGTRVPHPSTLGKLTARCGPGVVEELNAALLVKAGAGKVIKTNQVRADTTVVPANVTYPTDSGLLVRAITLIVTLVARIHAAGAASRTGVRDRRRAAGRRARSISAHLKLRNDEAKARVLAITGELTDLAEASAAEATRVLVNARRHLRPARRGGLRAAGLGRRRAGGHAGADHPGDRPDPDPARRDDPGLGDPAGVPARPGRPPDRQGPAREAGRVRVQGPGRGQRRRDRAGPQRAPRATPPTPRCSPPPSPGSRPCSGGRRGRSPPTAATARPRSTRTLTGLGVKNVVIPRKGKPSAARRAAEHARGFRRLVKWRTGAEGRISYLKTPLRPGTAPCSTGCPGAQTWCGLGVLAHNTVKIAALVQAKTLRSRRTSVPETETSHAGHRTPGDRTTGLSDPPTNHLI